jgi:hypothetical protein
MRPIRWVNVALGAWLLLAPWPLGFALSAHGMSRRREPRLTR